MEQQPSPPMGESEFPSASSSLADLAAQVEQHLVDLMKQQSLAPGIAPEGFWDNVQGEPTPDGHQTLAKLTRLLLLACYMDWDQPFAVLWIGASHGSGGLLHFTYCI
jgi:hypothetical protein